MKVIDSGYDIIEFFPDIIHTRHSDLKRVKNTKQFEQSETRP